MTEKKTLRSIVIENWDVIASNLDLDIENRPENMFLMLRYLGPILESAASVFPSPAVGLYRPVQEVYKKDFLTLETMGFADCTTYKNSEVALTSKGVELINYYHKSKKPGFLTEDELINEIIKLSDHRYQENNTIRGPYYKTDSLVEEDILKLSDHLYEKNEDIDSNDGA